MDEQNKTLKELNDLKNRFLGISSTIKIRGFLSLIFIFSSLSLVPYLSKLRNILNYSLIVLPIPLRVPEGQQVFLILC